MVCPGVWLCVVSRRGRAVRTKHHRHTGTQYTIRTETVLYYVQSYLCVPKTTITRKHHPLPHFSPIFLPSHPPSHPPPPLSSPLSPLRHLRPLHPITQHPPWTPKPINHPSHLPSPPSPSPHHPHPSRPPHHPVHQTPTQHVPCPTPHSALQIPISRSRSFTISRRRWVSVRTLPLSSFFTSSRDKRKKLSFEKGETETKK